MFSSFLVVCNGENRQKRKEMIQGREEELASRTVRGYVEVRVPLAPQQKSDRTKNEGRVHGAYHSFNLIDRFSFIANIVGGF